MNRVKRPRCRLDIPDRARSKEFDPERALAKAMSVFWHLGYENASMDTLMKEMGIARQSLYDTFGDKRSLYLKALAYYRDETNSGLRRLLDSHRSVKKDLPRFCLASALNLASGTSEVVC